MILKLVISLGMFGLAMLFSTDCTSVIKKSIEARSTSNEVSLSPDFRQTFAEMEAKINAGTDTPQDVERFAEDVKKERDRIIKVFASQ